MIRFLRGGLRKLLILSIGVSRGNLLLGLALEAFMSLKIMFGLRTWIGLHFRKRK